MKLSKKSEYALRALIEIATRGPNGIVQIPEIAAKENIPEKFLEAILLQLKNAGVLRSKRGVGGGYSFSRYPSEVTLGEVIRLMDGPLAPIACVSRTAYEKCSCPSEEECGLRAVMIEVRQAIIDILDKKTVAEVIKLTATRRQALQEMLNFEI
ncbi:MAG: Rrf2 family transcriptional regulator [Verrucomicrobiae bacterium]|nr:Rrf2 family transcriptional regulator [Verrucomicrobiae bacterium]